ncbi:unnamed protein product, partial [Meganyctiphanes norvegica]
MNQERPSDKSNKFEEIEKRKESSKDESLPNDLIEEHGTTKQKCSEDEITHFRLIYHPDDISPQNSSKTLQAPSFYDGMEESETSEICNKSINIPIPVDESGKTDKVDNKVYDKDIDNLLNEWEQTETLNDIKNKNDNSKSSEEYNKNNKRDLENLLDEWEDTESDVLDFSKNRTV